MEREEGQEDLGARSWSVALPVPATLSLGGKGERGQAWRAAGMQNQWERVGMRENVLARKWGRKDMHATEMGGERQGWEPRVCPPAPFPRDTSRPSSTAPMGTPHGIGVPTPFFYNRRHLGPLSKVQGGERRKARAASEVPKHSLMKRFLAWGGRGEAAPARLAAPVWVWPQRRLPLTWW